MFIVTVFWMIVLGVLLYRDAEDKGYNKVDCIKSWIFDLMIITFLYTMNVIGVRGVAILMLISYIAEYAIIDRR